MTKASLENSESFREEVKEDKEEDKEDMRDTFIESDARRKRSNTRRKMMTTTISAAAFSIGEPLEAAVATQRSRRVRKET